MSDHVDSSQTGIYDASRQYGRDERVTWVNRDADGDGRTDSLEEHRPDGSVCQWSDTDGDGRFESRECRDTNGRYLFSEIDTPRGFERRPQ